MAGKSPVLHRNAVQDVGPIKRTETPPQARLRRISSYYQRVGMDRLAAIVAAGTGLPSILRGQTDDVARGPSLSCRIKGRAKWPVEPLKNVAQRCQIHHP